MPIHVGYNDYWFAMDRLDDGSVLYDFYRGDQHIAKGKASSPDSMWELFDDLSGWRLN